MTEAPGSSVVGVAWRSLLERLGALGEVVEREAADEVERAEGYRHLTRLLSVSAERFVEKADPERPAFTRVITPWRKFIGDNPDTLYDVAPVEPGGVYRLKGKRHDALYLGVTVYGRDAGGGIQVLGQIADVDFCTDEGSFEVFVGGEEPGDGQAWIPLPERAESLWVRQYFHDPGLADQASFRLRREDLDPGQRPPLDEHRVATGLDRMAEFMMATLDAVTTLSGLMAEQPNTPLMEGADFAVVSDGEAVETGGGARLDELLLRLGRASHPTPDNRYAGVWFELDDDQCLVVTGRPPPNARYWGVQLANRWQESLDYLHHGVCLNDRQIRLEPDGTYRIIVCGVDPGVPNWLDTAGHRCGMVNVRALLADDLENPSYAVVPVASIEATA